MGNIASVHLEQGKVGEFFHNDRSKPTKNSIFPENKIIVDRSAKEALELYNKLLKERTEKYINRTGRKLQKKTQTLLSVIVNTKESTTLQNLQKLAEKFEKEFGATPIQIAIHRDEGYVDENGQKHINYHAHIMLMGLDSEGYSVKRKIKTRHFRAMQDWAAEILGMERGKSVKITKRKRLNTYEYKEAMRLKNKEIIELKKQIIEKDNAIEELKLTKKDLEQQIKQLREQMKNFNAGVEIKEFTKEDYQALSNIKKLLKTNDLKEIEEKLRNFESEIKQRIKKRQLTLIEKYKEEKGLFGKEEVVNKDIAVKIVKTTCKPENVDFIKLIQQNKTLEKENNELREENEKIRETTRKAIKELKENKETIKKLEQENKKLTEENNKLKNIVTTLIDQLTETKARISKNFNKAKELVKQKIKKDFGINF